MASCLTFKSSTLFEVSFVYSMRKCLFLCCSSLSRVWLFATHGLQHAWLLCPPLSLEVCSNSCLLSQWLSNHFTLCHPLLLCLQSFLAWGSFPVSWLFQSGCQSIGALAWSTVLPMNIQDWFPLGWTGWISLQSQGLSRVFLNTTIQKHQFFSAQPSLWFTSHIHTWLLETIALTIWTFVSKVMSLLFDMLSRFVIAFLSRRKYFLISWLQSLSTVILEPKKIKSVTASTFSLLFAMKRYV